MTPNVIKTWNVSVLTFAAAFPLALAAQNTPPNQKLGNKANEENSKTLVACLALGRELGSDSN